MTRDNYFQKERWQLSFYDPELVNMFDDMLERSVPFYSSVQEQILDLSFRFAKRNTNIYDLWCSTWTTLSNLDKVLNNSIRLVGYDASMPMILKAQDRKLSKRVSFKHTDVWGKLVLENASVVILSLTLQFIQLGKRKSIVKDICQWLNEGWALILFEKIAPEDTRVFSIFEESYFRMKSRNWYSDLEIKEKKDSLNWILVPNSFMWNISLLSDFSVVEPFFCWYNFAWFLAIK